MTTANLVSVNYPHFSVHSNYATCQMTDDAGATWNVTITQSSLPIPNGSGSTSLKRASINMDSTQFGVLCSDLNSTIQFNLSLTFSGTTITSYDGTFTSNPPHFAAMSDPAHTNGNGGVDHLQQFRLDVTKQFADVSSQLAGLHGELERLRGLLQPKTVAK